MKISAKLICITLACSLLPLMTMTAWLSSQMLESTVSALEQRTKEQLITVRALKKEQIESYFSKLTNQILTHAQDPTPSFAVQSFGTSIDSFIDQSFAEVEQDKQVTQALYNEVYLGAFPKAQTEGFDGSAIYRALSDSTISLQAKYIANNPNPLAKKSDMIDGGDSSGFTSAHYEYHEVFKRFAETYGLDDIYLIDAFTGKVVYSVAKKMDFATSLNDGPFSNSALAQAFKGAMALSETGGVFITDIAPYLPAFNAPTAFIATPMTVDDYTSGVLVYQLPLSTINNLMTSNQQWNNIGLGKTGETYLVGKDKTARSDTREFLENPADLTENNQLENGQEIAAFNTTISFKIIDNPAVNAALSGETGIMFTQNYRLKPVISAYTPITIGNLEWALISEIHKDEAINDVAAIKHRMIIDSLISITIVGFLVIVIAYKSSSLIVVPLRNIVASLTKLADGKGDLTQRLKGDKRKDEIGQVSTEFNRFLEFIQSLLIQVKGTSSHLVDNCKTLNTLSHSSNQALTQQKELSSDITSQMSQYNNDVEALIENINQASNHAVEAKGTMQESNNVSQQLAKEIDTLFESTNQAASTLQALDSEVTSVASVLEVINSIAEQTNLLALNAAIEAARAGDTGRGFAVVADEVRGLAAKTQLSTVEIKEKLTRLRSAVNDTINIINDAKNKASTSHDNTNTLSSTIDHTTVIVNDIAKKNQMIAGSAKSQEQSITNIYDHIKDIASLSDDNVDRSNHSVATIENLKKLSNTLDKVVNQFKL